MKSEIWVIFNSSERAVTSAVGEQKKESKNPRTSTTTLKKKHTWHIASREFFTTIVTNLAYLAK